MTTRLEKGAALARNNMVSKIDDKTWLVHGRRAANPYCVERDHIGYTCECMDWRYNRAANEGECKHIHAVMITEGVTVQTA